MILNIQEIDNNEFECNYWISFAKKKKKTKILFMRNI